MVLYAEDIKEDGFFRAAWEAMAGLFAEAAENQPRDQVATKVLISGNINQPDADISTTVILCFVLLSSGLLTKGWRVLLLLRKQWQRSPKPYSPSIHK